MQRILTLLLVLACGICSGQTKQNYVWKFGDTGAGLDFVNCKSDVLTNGINNGIPFEGQSAISDEETGSHDSTRLIRRLARNATSAAVTETPVPPLALHKETSTRLPLRPKR